MVFARTTPAFCWNTTVMQLGRVVWGPFNKYLAKRTAYFRNFHRLRGWGASCTETLTSKPDLLSWDDVKFVSSNSPVSPLLVAHFSAIGASYTAIGCIGETWGNPLPMSKMSPYVTCMGTGSQNRHKITCKMTHICSVKWVSFNVRLEEYFLACVKHADISRLSSNALKSMERIRDTMGVVWAKQNIGFANSIMNTN